MQDNDPEKYGVEKTCGECGGRTIAAREYIGNAEVPHRVRAKCVHADCRWAGKYREFTPMAPPPSKKRAAKRKRATKRRKKGT